MKISFKLRNDQKIERKIISNEWKKLKKDRREMKFHDEERCIQLCGEERPICLTDYL